jgi:hypothetical protein
MRRKNSLVLATLSTLILGIGALLWPGLRARAQVRPGYRHGVRATLKKAAAPAQEATTCKSFSAIVHAVLPSSTPMANTDSWGGPLYGMLGDEYLGLKAALSGNDGEETWYEDGTLGVGKGGTYTVCTDYPGCQNTFTYEVPFAVFPSQPGALMDYIAYGIKIVKGSGKFASASGSLDVRGPAVAWPDDSPLQWAGRWTAQISGTICGIQ